MTDVDEPPNKELKLDGLDASDAINADDKVPSQSPGLLAGRSATALPSELHTGIDIPSQTLPSNPCLTSAIYFLAG